MRESERKKPIFQLVIRYYFADIRGSVVRKKTPHPYKYLKFKGCFGGSYKSDKTRQDEVDIGNSIEIYDESVFSEVSGAFNTVLNNPEQALAMRKVKMITINGGLLLKAFFDEFYITHGKKPYIKGPKDKKMRAVLNYLKIKNYNDVKVENYPDIMCWQIFPWDHTQEIEFGKLLDTEIIPKCWKGNHAISEHSANIATSVAEALLNCKEHAYTGEKSESNFKQWYLGVGEYPETNRFSFCIYDKGVGIKARLKSNPTNWFIDNIADIATKDSAMIEAATKGKRVVTEDGRGQGLKNAIELLEKNNGNIDIFSDCGYFSSHSKNSGKDRKPKLEGTMVSFSFPIKYSKDNV